MSTDELTNLPLYVLDDGSRQLRLGNAGIEMNNQPLDQGVAITQEGLSMAFDISTINPKRFSIKPTGVNFTDNTNSFTTTLSRLCAIQQAFQAVDLPPNATTLQINKTLLMTDGTNSGSIGLNSANTEITATGDLILNPTGSISANGKTLDMTGGEIHKVPLIHGPNNADLTIEGKGTGDIILKTGNTNRLTISDTGDWTVNGGMSYNNATNTLTATTFQGNFVPTSETISGTTAISPNINTTFVSGSNHSLASGTIIGQEKTIVKTSENAFIPILNSTTAMTNAAQGIQALKYDPTTNRMYVGGQFDTIGGVAGTLNIAYYDFTAGTWNAMSGGCGSSVSDIIVDSSSGRVYVCGSFTTIAGSSTPAQRIAYWTSGVGWNQMYSGGSALSGTANRMMLYGGSLYVGGSFTTAGGITCNNIARWDIAGATWNAMGAGTAGTNGNVNALEMEGATLWVGGAFTIANGQPTISRIAKYDTGTGTWSGVGNYLGAVVNAISLLSAGTLFVQGAFTNVNTSTQLLYSATLNTSTNVFSQYGVSQTYPTRSFVDTDGTLWLVGGGSSSNISSNTIVGIENIQPPQNGVFTPFYYDTTANRWAYFVGYCSTNVNAIERTNVAGEYWIGGIVSQFDGNNICGVGGLLKMTKGNISKISSSLVVNGKTNRNQFHLTWKGQIVKLVNINNTNWAVVDTSIDSAVGTSIGRGQIFFY